MVSVDSVSLATVILNSLNDTNLSESNLKTVYSIYNNTWMQGQYFFSPADSATLYNIAVQHASDAGDAVYSARVMLNLQVDEFGNANSNRMMQFEEQTVIEDSISMTIFPNPSFGLVTVNVQMEDGTVGILQIIDVSGKVIAIKNISSPGNYKFETETLDQGLYFVELIKNGVITETKKLQVIKQ